MTEQTQAVGAWLLHSAQRMTGLETPVAVRITDTTPANNITVFTILIDQKGMGRLIGKQGRHIRALRVLLHVFSQQDKAQYSLSVQEGEGFEIPAAGKCLYCGCTDDEPCLLGMLSGQPVCSWVNAERNVCSNAKCLESHIYADIAAK